MDGWRVPTGLTFVPVAGAGDEPALFAHYSLPYQPGASGQRRLGRR